MSGKSQGTFESIRRLPAAVHPRTAGVRLRYSVEGPIPAKIKKLRGLGHSPDGRLPAPPNRAPLYQS